MVNKIYFPNLDGLRFVAFFLVFWQHTSGPLSVVFPLDKRFYLTGGMGVSFFFVLSGFLITHLLLDERKRNGAISVKAFYARRVLRIFPLYYLVVAWGFALYPLLRRVLGMPSLEIGGLPLYLSFLANFDTITRLDSPNFLGVLWSISIEEQFYLGWAILFAILPSRYYRYLFLAVIFGSTAFRFLYSSDERLIYFHTFGVISDMAVGGGLAYIAADRERFRLFFAGLGRRPILLGYLVGLLITFVVPIHSWWGRLLSSFFFAFVIAEQNWSERSLFKMADSRVLSKLGTYTYGLYCLHMIALYFMDLGVRAVNADITNIRIIILYMIFGLLFSVVLAYISYEYYEKLFLRLKSRFSV